MVDIIYRSRSGEEQVVAVEEGMSLMEGAMLNGIEGIEGICGGICSCGTCHILVADDWSDRLAAPGLSERLKLEQLEGREQHSRLACQLTATAEIDGLVVTVANT